jgi:hypothetical protein
MASRFRRGGTVYDKHGRSYVVEDVEDGIVYCSADNGVETEFPEAALTTETERTKPPEARPAAVSAARPATGGDPRAELRGDDRRARLYDRLKASRAYLTPTAKLDAAASQQVMVKIERLLPGMLDFTAFMVAKRFLAENGDSDLAISLSVAKCREVFETAKPEVRTSLLADLVGSPPDVLVGAGRLGDNLMRAMLDKFLDVYGTEFSAFRATRK